MAPEQKTAVEYTAQATSPVVNGEVKIKVGENNFTATGLFDTADVPYVAVNSLEFSNYVVLAKTDEGDFSFSRMGSWAQPFFDALCEAYKKAMLRAFFVSDGPVFDASGDYRFTEDGPVSAGKAPVSVYKNCVVVLPPNGNARRIPLCFVNGIDKGSYELTLRLNLGESYTFSKLGYGTDMFAETIEKQIRALHEKAVAVFKEIDPTLTASQASELAKLISEGAAASVEKLTAISPSFVSAIEEKISKTRVAESYKALKEMCDPAKIWIGLRKNDIRSDGKAAAAGSQPIEAGAMQEAMNILPEGTAPAQGGEKTEAKDPYLFWIIAPSPNGRYAAVEFAVQRDEAAATFVYRTDGDFQMSAVYLNRALEAISFKREVIPMPIEELRLPENVDYYMAAKRTSAMQHVRANFVGRVIHSNPEAWKRNLAEMWKSDV